MEGGGRETDEPSSQCKVELGSSVFWGLQVPSSSSRNQHRKKGFRV